jgi:hypothetical protein
MADQFTLYVSDHRGRAMRGPCSKDPHPGAQLSLFDTSEGFRHTCFITNASAL